ncbi:hypothetical protein DN826_06390 [Stutzerimonas nosocomialis]|uniref:hypothetical protein n=1 Tax=Stutzerimonas nosocomialis TaxID=1056496 RepID=UPI0011081A9F|nr:hypothetical protein [Stutzerimonas nosocomialis]TLX57859.1 hypothetical protein DN826_06390 [Stutzerimonas nosocomialis]
MFKFLEVTALSTFSDGEKRIINMAHIVQVTPSEGDDWSKGAVINLSTGDSFHLSDEDTTRVLETLRGKV